MTFEKISCEVPEPEMTLHFCRQKRLLAKLALNRSGQFAFKPVDVELVAVLRHWQNVPRKNSVTDSKVVGEIRAAAVRFAAQLALGDVTSGGDRRSWMGRPDVGVEVVLAEVEVAAVFTFKSVVLLVLLLKRSFYISSL